MTAEYAVIDKYLQRHAEPESRTCTRHLGHLKSRYDRVLVVPIYDEPLDNNQTCLDRILPTPSDRVLTIAVVNVPDNAPAQAISQTQTLLEQLIPRPDTLTVDRASAGKFVAHKEGVGLARKIGCDIALKLIRSGVVTSPWIYQTDADAQLPDNYFAEPLGRFGACVFGHIHRSTQPRLHRAAQLYDAHMAYYVAGLSHAGSSYAFPTLGSTIAIHSGTYAQVRGTPRRNAAEDFYLLNKVAKTARVQFKPNVQITLQARLSQRVPFGTGPALKKIVDLLAQEPSGLLYLSYHPRSFDLLGDALAVIDKLAIDKNEDESRSFNTTPIPGVGQASALLDRLGLGPIFARIHKAHKDPRQRHIMLNQWFDGFRQLRFIHEARHLYPDQPLLKSLAENPFPTPHIPQMDIC